MINKTIVKKFNKAIKQKPELKNELYFMYLDSMKKAVANLNDTIKYFAEMDI